MSMDPLLDEATRYGERFKNVPVGTMVLALVERVQQAEAERDAARTRVVTTVAALDALPLGSVVLDADGDVWQMRERGLIPGSEWACTERAIPMSTGAALEIGRAHV